MAEVIRTVVTRVEPDPIVMRGVTLVPRHGTLVAVDRLATPRATTAPAQAPVVSA